MSKTSDLRRRYSKAEFPGVPQQIYWGIGKVDQLIKLGFDTVAVYHN